MVAKCTNQCPHISQEESLVTMGPIEGVDFVFAIDSLDQIVAVMEVAVD
jgi:predicted tellurium resistance membrane protein TerC